MLARYLTSFGCNWDALSALFFSPYYIERKQIARKPAGNADMNAKSIIKDLQDFYLLSFRGIGGIFRKPFYFDDFVDQMSYAGAGSIVIVALVSLFIGMALSLQISAEFAILGLQMYTGQVVGISMISEVGPVTIGLIYAGRSGSGMASELGSMILRNQIDTLRVFGVDPLKKLVTPRILGSLVMLPCLTLIGDFVSMLGGAYVSTVVANQSLTVYWNAVYVVFQSRYIVPGVLKPFLFGLIISCVSCFTGLRTHGGAVGLKSATTRAFVISTILIIVSDFVVTRIILIVLGYTS